MKLSQTAMTVPPVAWELRKKRRKDKKRRKMRKGGRKALEAGEG